MDDENFKCAETPGKTRRKLDDILMQSLGHDWCGNSVPPLDNRSIYVRDDEVIRVFATTNDGFEVGIGYPNEWHCIIRKKTARIFAWWTFKLWVKDWFGLRTHIWNIALHHKVSKKWKLNPYPHSRDRVRMSSYDEWVKEHEHA